jgi:hypothetical protein
MARWNEDQERWTGRGDRYGEDERRFRAERGEEGGWRGREWRDAERPGEWRGERNPEQWRAGERGGEWLEHDERGRRRGAYGAEWERGDYGRPGWSPERGGYGRSQWDPEQERGGYGRSQWDPERERGGFRGAGHYYGQGWSDRRGPWADEDFGSRTGPRSWYGRDEWRREYGPRGGREDEGGPLERMGEKLKEGMRKLTGRGPKGYRRSDERIREDVCERIARTWVGAEDVEVTVERAEVTLTGFVESREDKRRIEEIADDVFGVEEVHNHLRLNRGREAGATGAQATTGSRIPAGTSTTGTGAVMSAQPGGRRPQEPEGKPRH